MKKLKNGKAADNNEVTGGIIMSRIELVIAWVWKLCNIASKNGLMRLFHCTKIKGRDVDEKV